MPTVSETVPGYEVTGGLASAGRAIRRPRSSTSSMTAIKAGLSDEAVKSHLVDLGSIPRAMSPAEYRKLIADENAKWSKVIKFAGIKLG